MQLALSEFAERALQGIAAPGTLQPDLTVLRVCSVAEIYVDEVLERLASRFLDGETTFQRSVAQVIRGQLHQSWPQRHSWLRESFGIAVDQDKTLGDFNLLIELRNALAHGGGRLTFMQRKSLPAQLGLEKDLTSRLGVHCDGERILCSAATRTAAIQAASLYVRELDAKAMQRF